MLKAVAPETAAIVVLTPAHFYHFRRPIFNFQPLSFTFETFGKKLAETKMGQWEENQSKKIPSIRVTSSVINNFVRAKMTLLGLFV
jgi:hypothetical protein